MLAAVFEMTSWMGLEQHIVKGKTACDLLAEFEVVQSLSCLVRMGRREEDMAGQKELDKLEVVLDKYHSGSLTVDELLMLDVKLSIGSVKCVAILEGEDAAVKLKEMHPKAR